MNKLQTIISPCSNCSLYIFSQSPFFSNKNRSSRLPLSGAPEKKKFLKILNTQKCAQPGPYNTHAAIINAMKYIGALITLTPLTFTLGNTCLCLSHVRIAEGREWTQEELRLGWKEHVDILFPTLNKVEIINLQEWEDRCDPSTTNALSKYPIASISVVRELVLILIFSSWLDVNRTQIFVGLF